MENCDTHIYMYVVRYTRHQKCGTGAQLCKMGRVKSQSFIRLLMLWFSIEFSDYGTTIVSQLSLHSPHGRSIWYLSLLLSRSS